MVGGWGVVGEGELALIIRIPFSLCLESVELYQQPTQRGSKYGFYSYPKSNSLILMTIYFNNDILVVLILKKSWFNHIKKEFTF